MTDCPQWTAAPVKGASLVDLCLVDNLNGCVPCHFPRNATIATTHDEYLPCCFLHPGVMVQYHGSVKHDARPDVLQFALQETTPQ